MTDPNHVKCQINQQNHDIVLVSNMSTLLYVSCHIEVQHSGSSHGCSHIFDLCQISYLFVNSSPLHCLNT